MIRADTPEQIATRGIFANEVASLTRAMCRLGNARRDATEMVILLLLSRLAPGDRVKVLSSVVDLAMGNMH